MNKKLHILFLSSWFPSRVNPLNGDFVQRHAEAVATRHNVTVLHIISDKDLKGNIEIHKSHTNNTSVIIGYIPKTKNIFLKLYFFISAYKKCFSKVNSFDIVHLNVINLRSIAILYLKWVKKKPYIITEHWTRYLYPNFKSIAYFEKMILKIIARNATFICPVSNNLKENMIRFGFNGNFERVPNVVNTELFKPQLLNSNSYTITHISSMKNEHKNILGILNTLQSLQQLIPNLVFNLIGDNSIKYKPEIEKLKLKNINFIDQISHIEVANYLCQSDLFILFSQYENLPCVILESFSCGTPVVSTDVGGINEFFPKEYGILVQRNDESNFKNAILKMYYSNQEINKEEMHKYAIANFGIDSIVNQFSKLYYKSLKSV